MNGEVIKTKDVEGKKVENFVPPSLSELPPMQNQTAAGKPVESTQGEITPQKQITAGNQAEPTPAETTKQKEPPIKEITHRKTLPNCRITGIDYLASLENYITEFVALEEIGYIWPPQAEFPINWDENKYEMSCRPDQAGEFEITMSVDTTKHERRHFIFKLIVNPDPKTLWKNIPSDQNDTYAKPDSDKRFLACGKKLSIAAASQRGRSHAQEGKPRDDDFLFDWDKETDCAILVVADGAGSAKFSRKGAQLAVQTALEKVRAALEPEFWAKLKPLITKYVEDKDAQAQNNIQVLLYKALVQAAWEAKTRIQKEAKEHEDRFYATYQKREKFTVRDYATTLILTIVKKLDAGGWSLPFKKSDVGGWFIATFWVGDGGMGVYSRDSEKPIVQGTPDGGEYGGQTRFLTEDSAEVWPQGDDAASKIIERRIRFNVVNSFGAVILMTDGVTDPKFETDGNLNSIVKWNELWADLEKDVPFKNRDDSVADALLKWMDFWSPGNHDDRTMLVLY